MRVNVSGCVWVAFVCCCFACDCVLELVVCRVRFARVSCPRLRFVHGSVPGNGRGKALCQEIFDLTCDN